MVYKNFFLRSIFSFFFIFTYFLISYFNFDFIFYLILLIYVIIIIEVIYFFTEYKFIPLIYITISLIFFLSIDFDHQIILSFNFYILVIVTFDIFSYLFGKILGKNYFIKISPNKTLEGLFGGIIFSIIISTLFAILYEITINIEFFVYMIILILTAFGGDIIESYFKRKNNLKNSSNLIPGHGGLFDRFDSFLFSIILYSLSINLLI